jgi:hypothetical protein
LRQVNTPTDRTATLPSVASAEFHTLEYAATLLGGEEALALRLGVTQQDLALWIRGVARPPVKIFLEAVDIVTEDAMARLSEGID